MEGRWLALVELLLFYGAAFAFALYQLRSLRDPGAENPPSEPGEPAHSDDDRESS